MSIHQVTGGTIELKDKLTVGARQLLQLAMFESAKYVVGAQQLSIQNEILLKNGTVASVDEIQNVNDLSKLPDDFFKPEMMVAFTDLQKATIIAFLKSWSFPEPIPTMATIDDMDADLFDEISTIVSPKINTVFQNINKDEITDLKAQSVA